jgi:hypothetical protein
MNLKVLSCLVICCLLFCGLFFFSEVSAEPVNGLITSDTIWSRENSPYELTGPVGVAEGATLTIEPGVTVDFGKFYIQVNGTLNAQGTVDNKIVLTTAGRTYTWDPQNIQFMPSSTPWNEQSGCGCIISNAQLNIIPVVIQDCSPKIVTCTFVDSAITVRGGSASIIGNTINCGVNNGINVDSGSPIVSGNHVNGNGFQVGVCAGGASYFYNNNVIGCWTGISITGSAILESNVISHCAAEAIESRNSTAKIIHNYISNSKIGIAGGANLQDNTIADNTIGIQNALSTSTIKNNNIVGNTQSIVINSAENVDASHNWWGTTDLNAIRQTIWDNKNDYNLGIVTVDPVLTAPNPDAPATQDDAPAATPTAPTEQPSTPSAPPQNQNTQPTPAYTDPNEQTSTGTTSPFDYLEVVVIAVVVLAVATVAFLAFRVSRQAKQA